MKRSRLTITLVASFIVLLMTGCASIEKTIRYVTFSRSLNESGLKELYGPEAAFDYSWSSGVEGNIKFEKSGSAIMQYSDREDSGSWLIRDNKLGITWTVLRSGREQCYTVYKRKGNKYKLFNSDGSYHAMAVLK